jgi:hypothetical protein
MQIARRRAPAHYFHRGGCGEPPDQGRMAGALKAPGTLGGFVYCGSLSLDQYRYR